MKEKGEWWGGLWSEYGFCADLLLVFAVWKVEGAAKLPRLLVIPGPVGSFVTSRRQALQRNEKAERTSAGGKWTHISG